MKTEINVALDFLAQYFYAKLPRRRINVFLNEIENDLAEKYRSHWYPEKPTKGSAFRCLKLTSHKSDSTVIAAAERVGFEEAEISACLPDDLTIWIDPGEVSCRIGSRGKVQVLYDSSAQINNSLNKDHSSFSLESNESSSPMNRSTKNKLVSPVLSSAYSDFNNMNTSPISSVLSNTSFLRSPFAGRDSTSSSRSSPVFTTEAFAKTRFGSTRLKNEFSSQYYHRPSGTQQQQQVCSLSTTGNQRDRYRKATFASKEIANRGYTRSVDYAHENMIEGYKDPASIVNINSNRYSTPQPLPPPPFTPQNNATFFPNTTIYNNNHFAYNSAQFYQTTNAPLPPTMLFAKPYTHSDYPGSVIMVPAMNARAVKQHNPLYKTTTMGYVSSQLPPETAVISQDQANLYYGHFIFH